MLSENFPDYAKPPLSLVGFGGREGTRWKCGGTKAGETVFPEFFTEEWLGDPERVYPVTVDHLTVLHIN